jgi:hypothetical protein
LEVRILTTSLSTMSSCWSSMVDSIVEDVSLEHTLWKYAAEELRWK